MWNCLIAQAYPWILSLLVFPFEYESFHFFTLEYVQLCPIMNNHNHLLQPFLIFLCWYRVWTDSSLIFYLFHLRPVPFFLRYTMLHVPSSLVLPCLLVPLRVEEGLVWLGSLVPWISHPPHHSTAPMYHLCRWCKWLHSPPTPTSPCHQAIVGVCTYIILLYFFKFLCPHLYTVYTNKTTRTRPGCLTSWWDFIVDMCLHRRNWLPWMYGWLELIWKRLYALEFLTQNEPPASVQCPMPYCGYILLVSLPNLRVGWRPCSSTFFHIPGIWWREYQEGM